MVESAGRLQLFEPKWTEVPAASDTANLAFVRTIVGEASVSSGSIVCRAPSAFPLGNGFRVTPVAELK